MKAREGVIYVESGTPFKKRGLGYMSAMFGAALVILGAAVFYNMIKSGGGTK